jgi:hypothetical protein
MRRRINSYGVPFNSLYLLFHLTDQTTVHTVANHKEVPKVPKTAKEELGTRK